MKLPKPPPTEDVIRSLRPQSRPPQQDADAGPDRPGGQLQLADVLLREHDRPAGGRFFLRRPAGRPLLVRGRSAAPGRAALPAGSSSGVAAAAPAARGCRGAAARRRRRSGPSRTAPPAARCRSRRCAARPSTTHLFDRPGAAAHAVRDAGAFEGGAGRGRGRRQLPAGQQHDLAVGADIDEQRGLPAVGQARGQNAGHGVAADEPADDRQHVGPAAGMDVQAELRRPARQAPADGRHERHLAQRPRVDAAEQLLHRRVAGER